MHSLQRKGRYLTTHGSFKIDELADLPCACNVCRTHTAEELRNAPERERLLALHNLYVTVAEISRIRQAIFDGTLWELVDERCRGHPQLLAGYRALLDSDGISGKIRPRLETTVLLPGNRELLPDGNSPLPADASRLQLGDQVLIAFDGGIRDEFDDTLFFKPPFGPYPKELKETFPVGQSEIPEWDDAMVRTGCRGITVPDGESPGSRFVVSCKPMLGRHRPRGTGIYRGAQ